MQSSQAHFPFFTVTVQVFYVHGSGKDPACSLTRRLWGIWVKCLFLCNTWPGAASSCPDGIQSLSSHPSCSMECKDNSKEGIGCMALCCSIDDTFTDRPVESPCWTLQCTTCMQLPAVLVNAGRFPLEQTVITVDLPILANESECCPVTRACVMDLNTLCSQ